MKSLKKVMTIPVIPDNFYKLLILCGLALLGFSYIHNEKANDIIIANAKNTIEISDSLEKNSKILEFQNQRLMYFSKFLLKSEGIDSIFLNDGVSLVINEDAYNRINSQVLKDSARKLIATFENDDFEDFKEGLQTNNLYLFTSYFLLGIGLFGFVKQQILHDKILKHQYEENRINTWCQSCGKLFSATRKKGKDVDGVENKYFCTECYDNGSYTNIPLTMKEILNNTTSNPSYQKLNFWKKKRIIARIKNGDRWNLDKY